MTKKHHNPKAIWMLTKPNGHKTSENLRALMRLQKHNADNTEATTQAISDMFSMTLDHEIDGMAAVALRSDGSHYLVISGMAIDQNIRASGAVNDLINQLQKLSNDKDEFI